MFAQVLGCGSRRSLIDPAILGPGRPIEGHERRFIHVHPVTGFVIVEQLNAIPQPVMQAVLQHHEQLDGSGYP